MPAPGIPTPAEAHHHGVPEIHPCRIGGGEEAEKGLGVDPPLLLTAQMRKPRLTVFVYFVHRKVLDSPA